MPQKFAMKITEEILDFAESLSGERMEVPEGMHLYTRVEILSPTQFLLEFKTDAQIFEEFQQDDSLEIIGRS